MQTKMHADVFKRRAARVGCGVTSRDATDEIVRAFFLLPLCPHYRRIADQGLFLPYIVAVLQARSTRAGPRLRRRRQADRRGACATSALRCAAGRWVTTTGSWCITRRSGHLYRYMTAQRIRVANRLGRRLGHGLSHRHLPHVVILKVVFRGASDDWCGRLEGFTESVRTVV